jgi:hypothetical protein
MASVEQQSCGRLLVEQPCEPMSFSRVAERVPSKFGQMLMNRFASVAGVFAIGLWASLAGAATGGPPIPNFNVRSTCDELQRVPEALTVDTGESDAIKHCLDAEQEAHNQLTKEWTRFSTADRNLCIGESKSGDIAPAYSELETCLQMTRDSRQLNSQETGENSRNEAAPQSAPYPTAQNHNQ